MSDAQDIVQLSNRRADMTQDEDVMRVWAKSMAERGWFVNVQASRVNEHFAIAEVPRAGWALERELAMARLASEASPAK
jgi:hypothetical protein